LTEKLGQKRQDKDSEASKTTKTPESPKSPESKKEEEKPSNYPVKKTLNKIEAKKLFHDVKTKATPNDLEQIGIIMATELSLKVQFRVVTGFMIWESAHCVQWLEKTRQELPKPVPVERNSAMLEEPEDRNPKRQCIYRLKGGKRGPRPSSLPHVDRSGLEGLNARIAERMRKIEERKRKHAAE
jgi:hypothetical protein